MRLICKSFFGSSLKINTCGREGRKRKEGKELQLGRWRMWSVMPSHKMLHPTLQKFLKLGWSFRYNLILYYIDYINRYIFLVI